MRPSLAAASRCLATSSTPVVSRSSRCTRRGRSPKRSAMPASMPSMWRLVPVPPCTARPNGLLSTRTWSSSKRIMCSMRSRSALESPSGGFDARAPACRLAHDLGHADLRAGLEPLVGLRRGGCRRGSVRCAAASAGRRSRRRESAVRNQRSSRTPGLAALYLDGLDAFVHGRSLRWAHRECAGRSARSCRTTEEF